jgi:hypothetical protein
MLYGKQDMNKYKICKFINENGSEWYQIKKKGWFFWYYVSAYQQLSRKKYPIRFYSMKEVNQHIKLDRVFQQSLKIKKVECFDYDPNR